MARVWFGPASRVQSASTPPGLAWAVTKVTAWAWSRWVRGMPAEAAQARAAVTPGTTKTGTPAARTASSSSPPRPKTKGSPPFNRTTR